MTNREFYNAIANLENAPAELVAFANDSIAKLDKANAAKSAKAAEKRAAKAVTEAPLYEAVKVMLDEATVEAPVIAATVASELNITSPKATVILKSFLDSGYEVSDFKVKVEGKAARVVKGYYKA